MNRKEAFIRCCKVAAVAVALIITFIAGICAKEGADSGFESFIGWADMAVTVAAAVLICIRASKARRKSGK